MSNDPAHPPEEVETWRQGLRMSNPPTVEALESERAHLRALEARSLPARWLGYLKLTGPGYMQSAMTLGGGTASASLFAGAIFGYQLLWVAPLAMLFGILLLGAVSHQTLSTGMRPFEAMRRFAGAPFAWGWALGALFSSIIWHFPQYSLAASFLAEMLASIGIEGLSPGQLGFFVLAWAIVISFLYGSSPRLVRLYETLLKAMVWGIVLCFGIVVWRTGIKDPGELVRGFLVPTLPANRNGVAAATVVISGLAAAVGVNMLFLYPYSLLARGWGREHRGLSRFDLLTGMFLPYVLATTLMVIATANTIYLDADFTAARLSPLDAGKSLAAVFDSETAGLWIFGLGVVGMALSSITLHMLCSGFVCSELFGWEIGGWRYRLACLLPTPGVLGPVLWSKVALWIAVPTTIVCGLFLPLAYVGFIKLQRSEAYLGDDKPRGLFGSLWIAGMLLATGVLTIFLGWYVVTKGPGYFESLTS